MLIMFSHLVIVYRFVIQKLVVSHEFNVSSVILWISMWQLAFVSVFDRMVQL